MLRPIAATVIFLAGILLVQAQNVQRLAQDPRVRAAVAQAEAAFAMMTPSNAEAHSMSMAKRKVRPQGAPPYTGLEVTGLLVGYQDPVVPCFNCVPGGTFNTGTPVPLSSIGVGDGATYMIQFSSDTYSGACSVAVALVRLSTPPAVVDGFTHSLTGGCQAGYMYIVASNRAIPASTGDHILIGRVTGTGTTDTWYNYLRVNP